MAAAGQKVLRPGELINVKVNLIFGNDVTAPMAIREFEKIAIAEVFDRDRVVLVPDHSVPNKDIRG